MKRLALVLLLAGAWLVSNAPSPGLAQEPVAEAWEARYNGPAHGLDGAIDLAVDASGNVYVAGSSDGVTTGTDYATLKYNAAGVQQWVGRYSGPGNGGDIAEALAIDGVGNVYVTGDSQLGYQTNYATVKYSSAGAQQWAAQYDGGNGYDWASDVAVDGAGNVFVTGRSYGMGSGYDYATVKYNAAGVQQWVAPYNGPGNGWDEALALAVDGAGNTYVTGKSQGAGTGYDYATVKYNAAGAQQWVARYDGADHADDQPSGINVDASGNVYVTGASGVTTPGETGDYATVKYNSAGVQQWVAQYNGPDNKQDGASGLAIDSSGDVYVTGESHGVGTDYDYATLKYNASGVQQWVGRYNGPGNGFDEATDVAVDASGNVCVTGQSDDDYATVKYNAAGVEQWVTRYDHGLDGASALALDGAGTVYVTGVSNWDYATVKYRPGAFPDFKQANSAWGGDYLAGNSSCPIANFGCALSSVADILAYYGTPTLTEGYGAVNPGNLNRWLTATAHGGYDGCGIRWGVADNSTGGFVSEPTILRSAGHGLAERKQAIDDALAHNKPPIVEVTNRWGKTHWIVLSGISGDSYTIVDPAGPSGGKLSEVYGSFYDVVIYQPGPSRGSWSVEGHSPIQLLITDPQGARTGFDPETGSIVEDIPSSSYGVEGGIGDDNGVLPPLSDRLYFQQDDPPEGTYSIEVIGVGDGPYEVVVSNVSESGATTQETLTGTAAPGSVDTFEVHVGAAGPVGGIAELPEVTAPGLHDFGSPPPNTAVLAGVAASAGLLLAAVAWFAKRRWLRRRA